MEDTIGPTCNFEEMVLFIINMLRPLSIEPINISWNYASFVYNGIVVFKMDDESIILLKNNKYCFNRHWNNHYYLTAKDLKQFGFKKIKTMSFSTFMSNKQLLVDYVQKFIKFKKAYDIAELKNKIKEDFRKPSLLDKLFKTKHIQSIFKEIDEITRG